jgi:hypothetical protein
VGTQRALVVGDDLCLSRWLLPGVPYASGCAGVVEAEQSNGLVVVLEMQPQMASALDSRSYRQFRGAILAHVDISTLPL